MSEARQDHPGFRATIAALSVGQLLSWAALYYAFSSFVLPMRDALGWSKPTLMGAFTLGLAVWGASSYATGAAIDRGHGRAVMTGGAVLASLGVALWSQVTQPWMLYVAWVLLGASMAMTLYEPAFNVVTQRYPLRFREGITALTLVGGFASTLAFPAAAALLAVLGWRGALLATSLVLLGVVAPLHAWALRGPMLVAAPASHGAVQADASLHEALRMRAFWLLTAAFTLYAFSQAATWAHVMPAFAGKGLSEAQALSVVVWVGPAQVAGRLIYAALARWMPLRPLGMAVLAGLPLALLLFALGEGVGPLIVFALLFGVANGLVTIIRGGLVPEYFGRREVGRIGGAMSVITLFSRAAAPLAAAWLLLAVPGYRELMLGLAALAALAVVCFALAQPPARRAVEAAA